MATRSSIGDLRGQDVIDSRDVIQRIEELEGERDMDVGGPGPWADGNPEDAEELSDLKALADEAEGYAPDWSYGEALIRDSHFEEYAQQLAEDLGAYDSRKASWPLDHIDWAAAAEALKQDYTSVTFAGEEYWIRS